MRRSDECLIYENAHFRAEHSVDWCLPGYLILSARDPVPSISGLSAAALQNLGPLLALLVRAIEAAVRPELVYCARFGEEVKAVHFHLFPRTGSMARAYLAEVGEGTKLNGPVLMDWARERYAAVTASAAERTEVKEATHAIREYIRVSCVSS